ncbi:MAG: wax ester/triacylglycerol synthase family O-acyltransferase [Solirubrobacteraceae bacterium]
MSADRLSALDASFLSVETPTAHMHVGFVASFAAGADGRLPTFQQIRDHIDRRIARAPRYRQKLASVPLGVNSPEWIDDPGFLTDRHVYWAPGPLADLVDQVMSIPLRRDRPLWEMWICENATERQFAVVGKAHHCMVDGIASVELISLLLDLTQEPATFEPEEWRAEPAPGSDELLARGVRDLLSQPLDALQWPRRLVGAPQPSVKQTVSGALRATRALDKLLRSAPASPLNVELSPLRHLAWTQCALEDLQTIKRAYGTTLNDVVLAAVAGGLRSYLLGRGDEPAALKVMVPVSVRCEDDILGNRLSFVFADLPCDEPDPVGRLYEVHASMNRCKRDGDSEGSDIVLKAAGWTPGVVQQALSRIFASPRAFNLTVSNIPGPAAPMYLLGCELGAVYPMVPLADQHALSVGMITVNGRACFGLYADREALADVNVLAASIEEAIQELLEGTSRVLETGSLLTRARAAPAEPPDSPESTFPPSQVDEYVPAAYNGASEAAARLEPMDVQRHERILSERALGSHQPQAPEPGEELGFEQTESDGYELELQRLANNGRSPTQ